MGHTHEDIDQVFSKVSDTIRHSGCESIPGIHVYFMYLFEISEIIDLLEKLNQSLKPNPISQLVQVVWDFKAWLKSTQGDMENHSKYHIFRFTKGSSSKVSDL